MTMSFGTCNNSMVLPIPSECLDDVDKEWIKIGIKKAILIQIKIKSPDLRASKCKNQQSYFFLEDAKHRLSIH